MNQFVRAGMLAIVAVPAALVWSQATGGGDAGGDGAATTRPTPAVTPRFDRGFGGMRGDGGPRGDGGGPGGGPGPGRRWGAVRDATPVSPDEWADVEQFMRVNSPVRLEMLKKIEDDLGTDRPITQVVRARLVQRYRDVERKRNDNADLYGYALKQIQSEDAVLGVLRDGRAPGADAAALDKKLDEQVRAFVDNNLAERQARIDHLKQILDAQTTSLQKDRASIDDVVAAQRDKFKKEMDGMLDFNARGSDDASTQPTKRPRA